jgi:predicted aspartyl protease
MQLRRWFVPCLPVLLSAFVVVSTVKGSFALLNGDEGVSCHVIPAHEPSAAEKAYLAGNSSQAESLYREALAKSPHDPVLVGGLVRSLLREQKIDDASAVIGAELSLAPNSAPLLIASAEVKYRQGEIVDSATTADRAFHVDPCNPRLYLLRARLLRLNSMYASERRAIGIAHSLDPSDMDIRRTWLGTLPLTQRIEEQKQFLAVPNGLDQEEHTRVESGLKNLQYFAGLQEKNCHLVSAVGSTKLPMAPIVPNGNSGYVDDWGLHVSLNNTEAALLLDTGASGLLVNRAIAEKAGLKSASRIEVHGIGDHGPQAGYVAVAASIRVGSLEFRDCMVGVTDRKDILGMDGIIGTDVFRSYLVTLDYPMRKFLLSQLPPRPTDSGAVTAALDTAGGDVAGSGSGSSEYPQDRYISPTMKDYFPVFRSGHDLIVPVQLNGKIERLFLVDTGASATIISPEVARLVTKVHGGDPGSIKGLSGEVAKVSTSEAVMLKFAGIQQQNNSLYAFDTSGLSKGAGIEISGFLGSTVLRQLTISIDYRDGLVKFDYDPHHGNHNF